MRAVILKRVSTDEQAIEGYSLDAQERACAAYVEAQGWQLVGIFTDEGISGMKGEADRPGLASALAALRAGQAQVLVVHKLDRLARSIRVVNDLIDEFQRRHIAFVAVADRIDLSTPFGWAAFQMQNVWNELYIKNLSFETAKGHREKARKGLWVGPVPYGYMRDGRTLAPSDEAAVVRLIFERYATGLHSYSSIADELNAAGYRTLDWKTGRRGLFGRESVRTILQNRAYCGYVSSGGVEFPGQHAPLVSEELWQRTNTIRAERVGAGVIKVRPAEPELLPRLVWCASCGSRMYRHLSGNAESRRSYYLCSGPRRAGLAHTPCDARMTPAAPIEQQIIALLQHIEISAEMRALIEEEAAKQIVMAAPMERPPDRPAIEAKLRRLARLYSDGLLDDAEYERERDALRAALTVEQLVPPVPPDLADMLELLADIPTLLTQAQPSEIPALIRPVLSHIWIQNRTMAAITPTRVFLPLLMRVWQNTVELERGCPTGIGSPLSTCALWTPARQVLIV